MIACGARTDLGGEAQQTVDASDDQPIDHPQDHAHDTATAPDADDASDDVVVADAPAALCGVCSADLNATETPIGSNTYQGAQWLAYEFPVACDQFAAWFAIHDDTAAVRVFADDGTGQPGAEIVPSTPTQPMTNAPGWFVIAASVQLQAGRSYWVATSITNYYGGSTHTAWSTSGTVTRYYGGMPWQGPYHNPPMIRAGNCK